MDINENWKPYIPLVDEQVGLMTCKRCGATVIINSSKERPTPTQLHEKWHKNIDRLFKNI